MPLRCHKLVNSAREKNSLRTLREWQWPFCLCYMQHAKAHVLTVCGIWFANTRYVICQLDMFLVVVVTDNLTMNGR